MEMKGLRRHHRRYVDIEKKSSFVEILTHEKTGTYTHILRAQYALVYEQRGLSERGSVGNLGGIKGIRKRSLFAGLQNQSMHLSVYCHYQLI